MSRFLEALESRTLLSAVTTATLAADNAAIVAAGANGTAAVKAIVADVKSGLAAITADLKGLPATNAPLLRTLKVDLARFEATISTELGLLIKPGEALAKKSTSTGESLFVKATTKNVAVAAAEITALGTVTTAPLANLLGAFHGNSVGADFRALVAANPAAVQLATDVTTTNTNADAQITTLQADATQFSTNIATLTSDLSSVKTTFGTFPNLVGTLNGTTTVLKGKHVGRVSNISIVITSEDAAGNIAGTLTDTSSGTVLNLAGTVTLNGKVAAKLSSVANGSGSFAGQFASSTLSGTFKSKDNSGTFTVTKAP